MSLVSNKLTLMLPFAPDNPQPKFRHCYSCAINYLNLLSLSQIMTVPISLFSLHSAVEIFTSHHIHSFSLPSVATLIPSPVKSLFHLSLPNVAFQLVNGKLPVTCLVPAFQNSANTHSLNHDYYC